MNDSFSQDSPVNPVPEVTILDFIGAKDDGRGGDNWRYMACETTVKFSPPTNQHPMFTGQMPFLSSN